MHAHMSFLSSRPYLKWTQQLKTQTKDVMTSKRYVTSIIGIYNPIVLDNGIMVDGTVSLLPVERYMLS